MRAPLTRVSDAAFRRAWENARLSRQQIAEIFGIGTSGVHRMAARLRLGARGRVTERAIGPDEEAAFRADWMGLMTVSGIARKYGVSLTTASASASRLGLPPKKRRRRAEFTVGSERTGCMVCGGWTEGRCGCRGRRAA